jgi:hypothetical protein
MSSGLRGAEFSDYLKESLENAGSALFLVGHMSRIQGIWMNRCVQHCENEEPAL